MTIHSYRESVHTLVDPNNQLPLVYLARNTVADIGRLNAYYIHDAVDDSKIGFASILFDNRSDILSQNFSHIRVIPKRQGFGMAAYACAIGAALHEGYTFKSDANGLTDGSSAIWRRLVDIGLAEVVVPELSGTKDTIDKRGEYQVTQQLVTSACLGRLIAH